MIKPDNPGVGIKGRRVGGEPTDVREHYYKCKACGQAVDKRDLGQVLHHESQGHEPITPDA